MGSFKAWTLLCAVSGTKMFAIMLSTGVVLTWFSRTSQQLDLKENLDTQFKLPVLAIKNLLLSQRLSTFLDQNKTYNIFPV